jgi:GTPase SAR1 family protein
MEYLTGLATWLKSFFWNQEMNIAIIGLQGAGKSTLVNSLTTSEFE